MVVVVILGILAALVAPNVIRRIDDARVTKAKQEGFDTMVFRREAAAELA